MTTPELCMWAVVGCVGILSWRNLTALALTVSWLVGQIYYLRTGNSLALGQYFMADIGVIAIIFAKAAICAGTKTYPTVWRQFKAFVTDLTVCDRFILGLFLLGAWPIYVSTIHPYYQWWSLWAITILQFLFAGAEPIGNFWRSHLRQRRPNSPINGGGFLEVVIPAQVQRYTVVSEANSPAPVIFIPRDAGRTSFRVSGVGVVVAVSQVFDAIIGWVTVNMVNHVIRPFAMIERPRHTVGGRVIADDATLPVSRFGGGSECFSTGPAGIEGAPASIIGAEAAPPLEPIEHAGFRLISNNLTERFRGGYFSDSHSEASLRGGQGQAALQAPLRPAFPTTQQFLSIQRAAERETSKANGGGGYA